jgi:lysophospholipase L1-like esterase
VTRRYLALGDSYTAGEGVNASEGWPMQLAASVRDAGVAFGDPDIVAKTGWTTAELLAAIDALSPPLRDQCDLVSLLIGVNDQYRGLGARVFRDGFVKLLSRAVSYARNEPSRVLVISIPDWGVTPFAKTDPRGAPAIAKEIDEFNTLIQGEARKASARFIDVTPASREAARDRALLAVDGLHPSPLMYAQWIRLILPEAIRASGAA